jgi:hypothetical protein
MMVEQSLLPSRRTLFNWFLFILAAKLLWLVLFTALRNPQWNPKLSVGTIGLYGGDSQTYYYPVEHLIATGEYYGMCRMPGVLPIYGPLRMFLSEVNAQQAIVVLQVIFDSVATLLLAILAARLFASRGAFRATILLSCATTFIALRNVYLLSDSFCISALITALFFLSSYFQSHRKSLLLYAGLFVAWAVFLRQITLLAAPIMGVMVLAHHWKDGKKTVQAGLLLALPLVLSLGAWTLRNQITYGRNVVLVAPLDECMYNLTPELTAIRNLIITMGEDFQPWSKGGGAYWFFNQPVNDRTQGPFTERHFTTGMHEGELVQLRADYRALSETSLTRSAHDSLQQSVVLRATTFAEAYKNEHVWDYHVGNKIRFAQLFLFPGRIDDIPFPSVDKMNLVQKGIKAWSLVALWLVHALAMLVAAWWLIRKRSELLLWAFLPFSFIAVLSYLGYIEQRYLATSFPFFILMIAGAFAQWKDRRSVNVQPR